MEGKLGVVGGGGASKKTEFEIACGIVCEWMFNTVLKALADSVWLMLGADSTTLEHSRRNHVGQRFLLWHGGYKISVYLQKNESAWKGCTQWEGQRNRQEVSESQEKLWQMVDSL